jgi:hypothetical protein
MLPEIVSESRHRLFGSRRIPDQRETAAELIVQVDLDDAVDDVEV